MEPKTKPDFELADDQPPFETELQRCRLQRRLGHLKEANVSLKRLQSSRDSLSANDQALVLAQIAWTLLQQGFFKEAYETLDQWNLSFKLNSSEESIPSKTKAFIELLTEFTRLNCYGDPMKSVEAARIVFAKELKNTDMKDYDYTLIQVEIFYHKIMILATDMGILDRTKTRAHTKARLQLLFDLLCSDKRWEELSIIAETLALVLDWPENADIFSNLLQLEDLPPLNNAHAHFQAGCLFELQHLYHVADAHFEAALDGFKNLGHAYGEFDIRIYRSGRKENPEDGSLLGDLQRDVGKGWLEILTKISVNYEEMAFPVGVLRALSKTCELAQIANEFELGYDTAKVCVKIAHETGSRLLWIQFQIYMLAASLCLSAREPTIIGSGVKLIETARDFRAPCFEGAIASILSLASLKIADNSQSIYWAEKSAAIFKDSTAKEQSLQEYRSALVRYAQNTSENTSEECTNQHLKAISAYLKESIEIDIAAEIWGCYVDKLLLLGQVQLARYRNSSVLKATAKLESCLKRALEISEKLEEEKQRETFATIKCLQVNGLMLRAKEETSTANERAAIECLKSALEVCGPNLSSYQQAHIYCQLGPPHWSIFTKTTNPASVEIALDAFTVAYHILNNLGITDACITAAYGIAYSLFLAGSLENFPDDQHLLSCFFEMEKWVDLKRNELSALRTIDAIKSKQSLSTNTQLRSMYAMSLEACIRLEQFEEAWHWMQKGKARSVSDLLGLGIKIPRSLLATVQDNPAASSLWQEEMELQVTVSQLPREKAGLLRKEIEILKQKMEQIDELRRIIDLRGGHAARLSNLEWAFEDKSLPTPNRSIVFVDWASTYKGDLFMFVVDKSRELVHFRLDINITDVKDWWEANFQDPDDKEEILSEEEDEDSAFRDLDALVEKLSLCSEPGDLLVLSPTGPLHSLPLHALRVPEDSNSSEKTMLLIERNPVIYCPNVTILEQCVSRAQSRLDSTQLSPPAIFAVYEDHPEETYYFDAEEQAVIYEHASKLGQHLHASIISGTDATKRSFAKGCPNTPLIHFHGHCNFDSTDVLSQSLILSYESPTTSTQTLLDQLTISDTRNFTYTGVSPESPIEFSVGDIFNLDLASPHVTLIACDSASQRVSAGDEPLGVLTAFLCAGAASVLGTMWPTATREGRAFSEAFYQCLGEQDSVGLGVFDYAEALRQAVLMIRGTRDSRLPIYWAPFVLHGAWFGKSFDIGQMP